MHQGSEASRRPVAGVCVTLWTGGDLAAALPMRMRDLLAETRPAIVCLHAGPNRLDGAAPQLARDVRAIVPGVRLWMGIGCDYWFGAAMSGPANERRARAELLEGAKLADRLGCESVVWDAEQIKGNSLVAHRLALDLVASTRAEFPAMIQGHTAYDHPTLHSDDRDGDYDDGMVRGEFAWRGWCAGAETVDLEVWQNYVAPEQPKPTPANPTPAQVFAGTGALARRIATSDASVARAIELGWIRPHIQTARYYQLHHVPFAQTVTAGERADVVVGWCGPRLPLGRMDVSGEYALRGLCALERAGARKPGGIAAFQRARGLDPDGVCGRLTMAALGIHVPADVR